MLWAPRIAGWRPGQVEARAADRKLVGRQLPGHDDAGLSKTRHREGIACGHIVLEQLEWQVVGMPAVS
jgi:hypothetical protein